MFSKKEIITFFIISIVYTLIVLLNSYNPAKIDFESIVFIYLYFYIPEIVVLLSNLIIHCFNITNEKLLIVIKRIIYFFILIYFGFIGYIIYAVITLDW